MEKCILVRGKPGSGKTSLAQEIAKKENIRIIDSGEVDKTSKEYQHFKPIRNRNPTDQVKKYSFLFHKAREHLENKGTILWCQPWSRMSEIMVTLQNFAYHFGETHSKTWELNPKELLETLPFALVIIELEISDKNSIERIQKRKKVPSEKINKYKKFNRMYQELVFPIKTLKLSALDTVEVNSNLANDFVKSLNQPPHPKR
ncbi:AAA family ATPase [Patescibacteria group bacterium]